MSEVSKGPQSLMTYEEATEEFNTKTVNRGNDEIFCQHRSFRSFRTTRKNRSVFLIIKTLLLYDDIGDF